MLDAKERKNFSSFQKKMRFLSKKVKNLVQKAKMRSFLIKQTLQCSDFRKSGKNVVKRSIKIALLGIYC